MHNVRFIITEETASLLTELANIETKKGATITVPTALIKEREQVKITCGVTNLKFLFVVSIEEH